MASDEELEIYRQRYETYRHLDKLRWQMLQIATATGALVLAFGKDNSAEPDWWLLAVVGLLLIILGFVMERIRHGISNNGKTLTRVGKIIGDVDIPSGGKWWKNTSFWIASTIIVLGFFCLVRASHYS